jgi:hypothetical protein
MPSRHLPIIAHAGEHDAIARSVAATLMPLPSENLVKIQPLGPVAGLFHPDSRRRYPQTQPRRYAYKSGYVKYLNG